jgi:hypothetical protein
LFLTLSCVMVTIWHQRTVSFKVLAQKGFIGTWICWVKCYSERVTMANTVFWLVDVGWMGCEGWAAHSADIHQSLHHKSSLALRGLMPVMSWECQLFKFL